MAFYSIPLMYFTAATLLFSSCKSHRSDVDTLAAQGKEVTYWQDYIQHFDFDAAISAETDTIEPTSFFEVFGMIDNAIDHHAQDEKYQDSVRNELINTLKDTYFVLLDEEAKTLKNPVDPADTVKTLIPFHNEEAILTGAFLDNKGDTVATVYKRHRDLADYSTVTQEELDYWTDRLDNDPKDIEHFYTKESDICIEFRNKTIMGFGNNLYTIGRHNNSGFAMYPSNIDPVLSDDFEGSSFTCKRWKKFKF